MRRKFLLLFSKRSTFLLYFMRSSGVDHASGSFLKKEPKNFHPSRDDVAGYDLLRKSMSRINP
jgi:hypothetical protein